MFSPQRLQLFCEILLFSGLQILFVLKQRLQYVFERFRLALNFLHELSQFPFVVLKVVVQVQPLLQVSSLGKYFAALKNDFKLPFFPLSLSLQTVFILRFR